MLGLTRLGMVLLFVSSFLGIGENWALAGIVGVGRYHVVDNSLDKKLCKIFKHLSDSHLFLLKECPYSKLLCKSVPETLCRIPSGQLWIYNISQGRMSELSSLVEVLIWVKLCTEVRK